MTDNIYESVHQSLLSGSGTIYGFAYCSEVKMKV